MEWDNSPKGRETHTVIPRVSTNNIQSDFYLNQIITGHGCVPSHQERFYGHQGKCKCGTIGNRWHVLYDCLDYDHLRVKLKLDNNLQHLIKDKHLAEEARNIVRELLTIYIQ